MQPKKAIKKKEMTKRKYIKPTLKVYDGEAEELLVTSQDPKTLRFSPENNDDDDGYTEEALGRQNNVFEDCED